VPDRIIRAVGTVSPGDTVPTGVQRIGPRATENIAGSSGVNVAVIDSGIRSR
jgi:hypothetical protein